MPTRESASDAALAEEIRAFIADARAGSFDELILRLFARQYALSEPYRLYCDSYAATPASVADWRAIPAVPARAFKSIDLSCAPVSDAAFVFHSSGTTEGRPSRHYLDHAAADLYTLSLRAGFRRVVPGELPIVALVPPAAEAPNSSLSFMLAALHADEYYWGDTDGLAERLVEIAAAAEPVCVFGTAFALLELFDARPGERWPLPPGSVVIETGGFKGRTRQVTRAELYALIAERLAVRPPSAMAEYGMSEMASQYYGSPEAGGLTAPHWLRARIIDPVSGDDAGEGLLRHYDLANWNSVAVIETQDMARRLPARHGAEGAFDLLGRAPGAELRGCSLTVEERWAAAAEAGAGYAAARSR